MTRAMADYDFSTLSPIDFEKLVNDLVQANEGVRVQRFGVGRDGGIDGRFAALEGNGIIQAKHFRASSFSQLKASLKKSKDQILVMLLRDISSALLKAYRRTAKTSWFRNFFQSIS